MDTAGWASGFSAALRTSFCIEPRVLHAVELRLLPRGGLRPSRDRVLFSNASCLERAIMTEFFRCRASGGQYGHDAKLDHQLGLARDPAAPDRRGVDPRPSRPRLVDDASG